MCALDKEIRKLNIHEIGGLSDILDYNNDWQILMDIIPGDLNSEDPLDKKYTWEDVMLIENEARRVDGKSCTKILLEEWGTSGKVRPRLSTLRELLIKVQLFRAAEYVSELLKVPYPERPSDTSAAKVSTPDVDQLPLVPIVPTPQPEYHARIQMPIVLPPTIYFDSNSEEQDSVQDHSTQPIVTIPHDTSSEKLEFMNFPYSTLANVTNNFSIIIGEGACGTVYSGKFYTDVEKKVAVKRLDKQGMNTDLKKGQFQNEITSFSKLNHPNLINLLGFSCDGEFLCLVYPYMKNGSLCDNLAMKTKSLHWKSRLDIALGIANGIGYLHDSELIHRDIKTANVLLDDRLLPKLSDFGLVRLSISETGRTIMTNTVVGTECYMPSEAFNGEISEKMDVFGYGVILLELLTGLPPYNEQIQTSLADFIIEIGSSSSSEDTVNSLIDKTAGDWGGNWETGVSNPVYQLALNCLEDKKNNRPDMKSIIEKLENIKKYTVR